MFSPRSYFKLGDVGYMELAKRAAKESVEDDCNAFSAAIAYYLLFALFPFFLFLTTIIGYLPIPHLMDTIMATLSRLLPGEASKMLEDNIRALFLNKQGGLLSLGFLLAIWTSSTAVTSLMDVMNRLYEVKEGRPFWKVRLIAVCLVFALTILFILSLLLIMFGADIGNFVLGIFHVGELPNAVWYVIIAPVVIFMLILAVALIYHFAPDVEQKWKWISPGSILAIPLWLLASVAFSFYVNNFGSYNKTYGSIGAVIILLFWMYISAYIILVGAEINSTVEHSSEEGKEPGEKVEGQKEREPQQVAAQRRENPKEK